MDASRLTPASNGSLSGLTVGRLHSGVAAEVAAWLLAGRGASVVQAHPPTTPFAVGAALSGSNADCEQADLVLSVDPAGAGRAGERRGARLRPAPTSCSTSGIPAGALDYATGVALALGALAAWRGRAPVVVSELGVAIQVFLPPVMAAAYDSPDWPVPPHPRPAPGGGWLSADLGATGDQDRFADLLASLPPHADAATIEASAQEWRLAVCEYKEWERAAPLDPILGTPPTQPIAPARRRGRNDVPWPNPGGPLSDITVCDLTAMWAGPLATWLLACLGAAVYKVEPDVRLDGTRALDGKGIYPGGRQRLAGEDSALFNALNQGKTRMPLDLREPDQRDQFVALARRSDVVIDSFSPRVMANFGLSPAVWGDGSGVSLSVSMPAFGPGPRRDWVAFGTGVHALSGLGDRGDGTFESPAVTYPDPISGFTAAFAVVAAIVGRDRGRPSASLEIPLAGAIQPLLAFDPSNVVSPMGRGEALYNAGVATGMFHPLNVAGTELMHPDGPFLLGADAQSEEGVVLG